MADWEGQPEASLTVRTSYTITGLKDNVALSNGTAYEVRVQAFNELAPLSNVPGAGFGEWSDPATATPTATAACDELWCAELTVAESPPIYGYGEANDSGEPEPSRVFRHDDVDYTIIRLGRYKLVDKLGSRDLRALELELTPVGSMQALGLLTLRVDNINYPFADAVPPNNDSSRWILFSTQDLQVGQTYDVKIREGLSINRFIPRNLTPSELYEGLVLYTFTATGAAADATLTWKLTGTDADLFSIDSASGELSRLETTPFDYETERNDYELTVSVTDRTDTDQVQVIINVRNHDEPATLSLDFENPYVDGVLTATLGDDPDGTKSDLAWQWERSADWDPVDLTGEWTAITTATSAAYTPEADDVGGYLRVTASCDDPHGDDKSVQALTVNPVTATEGGNRSLVMSDGGAATRLGEEHTPAATNLGAAFSATDIDGDTLTYTLSGTDAASFGIVSTSGQLQTKAVLDYETPADADDDNVYKVTVVAPIRPPPPTKSR